MSLPYSLRGDPAKARFLQEHPDTKCIEHTVLLAMEPNKCCCGDVFEGEYYLFFYGPERNREQFFAGPRCGRRLIEIGNLYEPNFFNPFVEVVRQAPRIVENGERQAPLLGRLGYEPGLPGNADGFAENEEMRFAISLLFYLWEHRNLEGTLFDIRKTLQENPHQNVGKKRLQILNNAIHATAINHHNEVMTLRNMFNIFARAHNRRARQYNFHLLEDRCREFEIQCHL